MSLILRCLVANRISLGQAGTWLGMRIPTRFSNNQILRLASACDVPADWLSQHLLRVIDAPRTKIWTYMGQEFIPGPWARDLHGQICPLCLQTSRYCQAAWSISGFCACPRHGVSLMDRCPRCEAPITWDRPDVDICRCRYPFACEPSNLQHDLVRAVSWSSWLGSRLNHGSQEHLPPPELPSWMADLSIDGAWRIVQAFGLLKGPLEVLRQRDLTRLRSPTEICAIVNRGLERLVDFAHSPSWHARLTGVVHVQGLRRLTERSPTIADREVASQLLDMLRHRGRHARGGRLNAVPSQRELFPLTERDA